MESLVAFAGSVTALIVHAIVTIVMAAVAFYVYYRVEKKALKDAASEMGIVGNGVGGGTSDEADEDEDEGNNLRD